MGAGGQHDNYGFALAAQSGGSQGRPANNSSSQLTVLNGLPTPRAPQCPCPGWSHHTSNYSAGTWSTAHIMPVNNPLERIIREIRRRTRVVVRFPMGIPH